MIKHLLLLSLPSILNARSESEIVKSLLERSTASWEDGGLVSLQNAVAIDSISVGYNPMWKTDGFIDEILANYANFATNKLGDDRPSHKIYQGDDAPPFMMLTIEGSSSKNVIIYSHADTHPYGASKWTHGSPIEAKRVAKCQRRHRSTVWKRHCG